MLGLRVPVAFHGPVGDLNLVLSSNPSLISQPLHNTVSPMLSVRLELWHNLTWLCLGIGLSDIFWIQTPRIYGDSWESQSLTGGGGVSLPIRFSRRIPLKTLHLPGNMGSDSFFLKVDTQQRRPLGRYRELLCKLLVSAASNQNSAQGNTWEILGGGVHKPRKPLFTLGEKPT